MNPLNNAFSRADRLLLSLGIVGIVLYYIFLPKIHPDSALVFDLDREAIIDRARAFAFNRGYNIASFEWEAEPVRNTGIIDSLKVKDKRPLYQIFSDQSYNQLPSYYWDVVARNTIPEGTGSEKININITPDGEVWEFDNNVTDQLSPIRDVLLQTPAHLSKDAALLDSTDTNDLVAQFWAIPPPNAGNRPLEFPDPRRVGGNLNFQNGDAPNFQGPLRFNQDDAKAIAQYYLNKSLLRFYKMSPDSVIKPRELDRESALVIFNGVEPSQSINVRAGFEITTSGVLKALNTTFSPIDEAEEQNNEITFSIGPGSILDTTKLVTYFILFIFTFILFLRRLNARLIDVKGAMQDAIWGGMFATLAVGNSTGWDIFQDASTTWDAILPALGLMLAAGSAGAFCVFIISCTTDSIARAVWPTRLASLTLARNVRFLNISMGLSLIRSCGLAGIFLGLSTLFLYLPGVSYASLSHSILDKNGLSPVVDLITMNGLFAMLLCMMVLLSIGATIYSKRPNNLTVIIVVTIVSALLQIGALKVDPGLFQAILSGAIGLILVLTLLRFDYFSCFGGFALYGILWHIAPHWLVSVSQSQVDVILAFSLVPLILIIGFIGLISRHEVDDTNQFVPTYLREMAQQERMRGELDIARQVQSSLLPLRMPTMPGVDIAAMCLPAQEVGGDYFDFIRMDKNRLAVVIGDVSGKGIQAGFFMTLTKGFLHAVCRQVDSPAEVLTRVNELFCKNAPRGTFISLIYGILDVSTNEFTFARAGHDPILHCSSKLDTPTFCRPQGMAIGLTPKDTFRQTIRNETIHLNTSDLLVFYTDGVTEAVNPKSEQFGVDRLAQKVESAGLKKSAQQVLQEISEHIQVFVKSAGRADDMTMVVLRIPPTQDIISATEISSASQSWLEHEA